MNQQPDLDSDAIRSEIDSTRGRMDDTIDALGNRLQGRHLLDEIVGFFRRGDSEGKVGEWREKISNSAGTVVDSVKAHPVPLLMIGAGIGWLIYQNRASSRRTSDHDEGFGYTGEAYGSTGYGSYSGGSAALKGSTFDDQSGSASSVSGKVKEKLASLSSQAGETVSDLTERGREKLGAARERATELGQQAQQRGRELYGRARERVVTTADQHPLEMGIGFLALGVIAGMAIPTPKVISQRLAPVANRLREASSDLVEKGKRIVQAATEAGKVEAKSQGLTLDRVREQAQSVAKRAGEAATETAKQ